MGDMDVILGPSISGLCSSSVATALALMTVITQLLLMDKISFTESKSYAIERKDSRQ